MFDTGHIALFQKPTGMIARSYDWKRYWVPRDGAFSFDSHGFILDPRIQGRSVIPAGTDAVASDDLLLKPCLVLLGEPGIGKSYAIAHAKTQTQALQNAAGSTILFRNLSTYTTDGTLIEDIFKAPQFTAWQKSGGPLHLFLDSLDECLLRIDAVAEILGDQLGRLSSVENLFLRIACRTAEWPTSLEDILCRLWGKDSMGVYELAALTRTQVAHAASIHRINPDQFIHEAVLAEVVPFAIKPLTLELLLSLWRNSGDALPPTQRALYENGCLELCSDSPRRQTPNLRGQFSSEHRLAVGAHIAATMLFCNLASIWTAATRVGKPLTDIAISELATGFVTVKDHRLPVTEQAIRETLDTGLFTARGRDRLGWAHQTYAEFLAARYLGQESIAPGQILDLLTDPNCPNRKLIPQLQETAAWAATPATALFAHLVQIQPEALLRSDVATAHWKDKSSLVDALMTAFGRENVRGDYWELRRRFRKLRHPNLSKQLRGYISRRRQPTSARIEAIAMAEVCDLNDLLPSLARLALDVREPTEIRRWAAATVSRSSDDKSKRRLRPLALGNTGLDPGYELRGAGLIACWPNHITADELFSSLPEPDDSIIGLYISFIRGRLIENLAPDDLPRALEWVASQPDSGASIDDDYHQLRLQILDASAGHIEDTGVLPALARALLSRLRKHEFSNFAQDSRLASILETSSSVRLRLADEMVQIFDDAPQNIFHLTSYGLRLLSSNDIPWLIGMAQKASTTELRTRYAHLLNRVFVPEDSKLIDAVLEASQGLPVLRKALAHWIKPVLIDSESAKKAREVWSTNRKFMQDVESRRKPKLLNPTPASRILALLAKFESGDVDAWWRLCRLLDIQEDGNWCEKHGHMDIRVLAGWKAAPAPLRVRLVAAAECYLSKCDANPAEWFARRNITYFPAVAGFRALLLLANENSVAFEALPNGVWKAWMPAILRIPYYDELAAHRLITTKAFAAAPNDAIVWTLNTITQENKEGDHLWILQKLPDKWEPSLEGRLYTKLQRGRLKPEAWYQLLAALLEKGGTAALDFARSKIPSKLSASSTQRERALRVSRLLLIHGRRGDWPRIWNLVCADASFGRALLETFAHESDRASAVAFQSLTENEIARLWEWMLTQYCPSEDRDRSRGGFVSTRDSVADLRNSLISHVADLGTLAGCIEIHNLTEKYPEFHWLRRSLLRAQEKLRRLTWHPLTPSVFYKLVADKRRRFVQTGEQLLDVVMDSILAIQSRLQGETPLAQFLWDGTRPKPEESLSEWIKEHLSQDLVGRGIVLCREVQIHRYDNTDIHVTAVLGEGLHGLSTSVSVIIEVKGDWNPDLKTAMRTQLAERYLGGSGCRHGLYLVGWFRRLDQQTRGDAAARARVEKSRDNLLSHLKDQAKSLTNGDRTVRALILDCSIPIPRRRRAHAFVSKPLIRSLSSKRISA